MHARPLNLAWCGAVAVLVACGPSEGRSAAPVRTGAPTDDAPTDRARFSIRGAVGTLHLARIGRGALTAAPTGASRVDGAEIALERGAGVTEAWRSSPTAPDYRIAIATRPAGDGALVLDIEVGGALGLETVTDEDSTRPELVAFVPVGEVGRIEPADLFAPRSPGAECPRAIVRDAADASIPARVTAVAGSLHVEVTDDDAQYPIVVAPFLLWHEHELRGPNEDSDARYGFSVSLSADGSRALVGSFPRVSEYPAPEPVLGGGARVLVMRDGTWVGEASLEDPDNPPFDTFGNSVALSADGTRAFVVAPGEVPHGMGGPRHVRGRRPSGPPGRLLVFARDGATWSREAVLPADGMIASYYGGLLAVTADGSRALVGTARGNGGARVFVRSGTSWSEEARLHGPGETWGDSLGAAVAISADGTHALLGAPSDDVDDRQNVGAAHLFVRRGTAWEHDAVLSSNGPELDGFGGAVALSADGHRAVIGSCASLSLGGERPGETARVFARTGSAWSEEAVFRNPDDPRFTDNFGCSVAISADGRRALVGAPGDGSVRVLTRTGSVWSDDALPNPPDGEPDESFGFALALSADGARALVGAPEDRVPRTGASTGGVRVFALSPSGCHGDCAEPPAGGTCECEASAPGGPNAAAPWLAVALWLGLRLGRRSIERGSITR